MSWKHVLVTGVVLVLSTVARIGANESDLRKEVNALKKEVEALRNKAATEQPVEAGTAVQRMLANKYGPNATVTTRQGKLTIGGLLQVWYYSIQNDNRGWTDPDALAGVGAGFSSNEVVDNDSFRIRRSELHFSMDINENVHAFVIINPANEAGSFPAFPSNQANAGPAFVNAGFDGTGTALGNVRNNAVRTGAGAANTMLQEAFINYHGVVPHHDFTIGQFKPPLGEEAVRSSGKLDFAERSMIGQIADNFDIGIQVHGTWWEDRIQYWLGAFNGSGTAFQGRANRSDTNDEKDLVGALLLRPVWKHDTWGSLELGYSLRYGIGGEAGSRFSGTFPVDGLNRESTPHVQHYARGLYRPGGPVRGWWLRGEWMKYQDRFAPSSVVTGNGVVTTDPAPFNIQGWYVSTGYHLGNSRWADNLRSGGILAKQMLLPMEFTFRYEALENLFHHDLHNPTRELDVFKTQIYTAGINYYIKGHNAKIQMNYNWVVEEDDGDDVNGRQISEVRNNNFVVNFQVAW